MYAFDTDLIQTLASFRSVRSFTYGRDTSRERVAWPDRTLCGLRHSVTVLLYFYLAISAIDCIVALAASIAAVLVRPESCSA